MIISNFCYKNLSLSLLGCRWSQHALLFGSEVRQPNGGMLTELQQGQHFFVVILYGGYKMGVIKLIKLVYIRANFVRNTIYLLVRVHIHKKIEKVDRLYSGANSARIYNFARAVKNIDSSHIIMPNIYWVNRN